MNNLEDASMDEILQTIRSALMEKERKAYFSSFYPEKRPEDEVFVLSKAMLAKREDIPYKMGVWNFDDVAKKMMKKYRNYFSTRRSMVGRVRVKEENKA
ncbi:MAG: hypothetical protein IJ218_05300 [Alphaproteobacteria bacterium]|nr:hypothetical protein [Alphaproteobacteria bacterium]